jgi:hypothetical protein
MLNDRAFMEAALRLAELAVSRGQTPLELVGDFMRERSQAIIATFSWS